MQQQSTIYASAARTATPTAAVISPRAGQTALRLVVDVTAIVTAPSITVTVEINDAASGKWATVLTSAAITTVSTNILTLVAGIASQVRVTVTHGNGNSITYSVGAHWSR
jgi:hypothetical protein